MSRASRSICALLSGIVLLGALLLVHGCGQGGIGGATTGVGSGEKPSPPVPILALSANPKNVVVSRTASGSTTLTAQVVDATSHVPLSGVGVSFFASDGHLASATVVSDSNGTVTDSLVVASGSSVSSIDVSAHAHGASQSLSIPIADLATIQLSGSPSFLQCSNGNSGLSVIQALALDGANNPLSGVRIAFTALGGITVNPLATTDGNGQAAVTVTAPTGLPSGSATIYAQAAGVTGSVNMPVTGCAGLPSPTPTPGGGSPSVLQFLGANPAQIGVLQSGQPQQSTLTFRLTDSQSAPVAGVTVDFFITSLGGESITPTSAVTVGDGTVQTVLTAGTRSTVVQVTAETGTIVAISTPLTIVGGPPVQGRLSAGVQFRNIAGNVTNGLIDPVTILMSDRFSNPVPLGTAVSLQSLGGAVSAPSPSDANGSAVGALIAESPTNPSDLNGVPTGGVATVLALTHGETPFVDLNGDGVWNPGEPVIPVPEPFFDLNGDGVREANEPFIDLKGNGTYDLDQSGGAFNQNIVVFTSIRVTFSGAVAATISPPSGFTIPNGGSQTFLLTLADNFGNPLVAGTTYQIVSSPVGIVAGSSGTVPDGESFGPIIPGLNQFPFTITDSDGVANPLPIAVTITVTSPSSTVAPGGNGNASVQINGTMN